MKAGWLVFKTVVVERQSHPTGTKWPLLTPFSRGESTRVMHRIPTAPLGQGVNNTMLGCGFFHVAGVHNTSKMLRPPSIYRPT